MRASSCTSARCCCGCTRRSSSAAHCVLVVENPRIVEAALHRRCPTSLIATNGNPSAAVVLIGAPTSQMSSVENGASCTRSDSSRSSSRDSGWAASVTE